MTLGDPRPAASAEELLSRNKDTAKVHQPEPLIGERPAGSPMPKTFIFCCFDPRVDPTTFLGIKPWDALVVRNGGVAVAEQLQILLAMDYFLGSLEDVFVIQHTDCGALHMTADGIKGYLKDRHLGNDEQIDELKFEVGNFFVDWNSASVTNVKLIKDSPFVREELKARTKGLIYDIKTGVLTELK